jgi:DnaJ-like protein
MHDRRAALEGLGRILDAGAPEDLFTGPEDEALFLHELLVEAAKARGSSVYWEICRTARRRGVTPDYVADRASVLLGTIEERRRTDLYRILGVPPLCSGELIRQHWLEIAKRLHPDVGGDPVAFQHAKQAYEVLRDPGRRAEYERFWLRTLGPFERVLARDDLPLLGPAHPLVGTWRRPAPAVADHDGEAAAEATAPTTAPVDPPGVAALAGLDGVLGGARALLARVDAADLDRLRTSVERSVEELERLRGDLAALGRLRLALRIR